VPGLGKQAVTRDSGVVLLCDTFTSGEWSISCKGKVMSQS